MNSLKELSDLGIDWETVKDKYQILMIPSTVEEASSLVNPQNISGLIDTDDSIHLSKLLKSEGVSCANSYDLGLDSKILQLRNVEIQLGIIWILNKICLPIVTAVIGRIIGEKIINRSKSKSSDVTEPIIRAEMKLIDNKITTASIKYDGDGKTFLKLLEGLKDD